MSTDTLTRRPPGKLAVSILRRTFVLTAIFASWTFSNYDQRGLLVITTVATATVVLVVLLDALLRLAVSRP